MKDDLNSVVEIYMREITRHQTLSQEEEVRLAKAMLEGDAGAGERLIQANLRLVVYHAQRYRRRSHLDISDLIQEGNIGLMHALQKFDYTKGFKFSTYASWWIKQSMSRASRGTGTIKLPGNRLDKLDLVHDASTHLSKELGRTPTDAEIADLIEMPLDQVRAVRLLPQAFASLTAPIAPGDDSGTLQDVLSDPDQMDAETYILDKEVIEVVSSLLEEILPPRELLIFKMRFGLDDNEPMTMEEIGNRLDLTRERVRQIIAKWQRAMASRLSLRMSPQQEE